MIWSVEMRLLVDDERWDVLEVETQLAKTVAIVDPRPKFVTAAFWLVQETEKLKRQPEVSKHAARGGDWLPQGRTKKRLGKEPQT